MKEDAPMKNTMRVIVLKNEYDNKKVIKKGNKLESSRVK